MIKVLWAVNIIPKEITKKYDLKFTPFGGWIDTMRNEIEDNLEIDLAIACHAKVEKLFWEKVGNVTYYVLPEIGKHDVLKSDIELVLKHFCPDILHMEGTEFPYTKSFLEVYKGKNVVSLQGIINGYKSYQYGELQIADMMYSFSFSKMLLAWSLFLRKQVKFSPRLSVERESLKLAKNFIGRTTWDRAHAYFINPNAEYYHCGRILREPFYNANWNIDFIERQSIFIGNSYSALKGAHHVLEAVSLLKREFPNIKVYIAGEPPYVEKRCKNIAKYVGYSRYLRYLINKLNLSDNVYFTGVISADQLIQYLTKVNAYVLPSSIENSPNTLGEAMLVGVPCIASYVGGVPDMTIDNKEALLYRSNDPVLLAWKIKEIFCNDNLALMLSSNGKQRALTTHNPQVNAGYLIDAYKNIMEKEE